MDCIKAWIKAARLPAQFFIFPSLLLGQSIVFYQTGTWSWVIFIVVHIYGLLMHLFIVYANDYADYDTDKINNSYTPFTGGSRVLVDGLLKKEDLLKASIFMAILIVLTMSFLSVYISSILPLLLALIGIFLLHAYSFSPIKMSYRGFGEILQVIGVGVVLPLIGYVSQLGSLMQFPIMLIAVLLPAQYAMAISTSLPDEPSDRLSNKHTTVVILGVPLSRVLLFALFLLTLSILLTLIPIANIHSALLLVTIVSMIVLSYFSINKNVIPGSKPMTVLVAFSIFLNTFIVASIAVTNLFGLH